MTVTRAAIYARVSSAGQREHKTIESQLRVLPEYVRRQGWDLVGEYADDGKSAQAGRLEARQGFTALLADMALGRFDVVCVVDIDRITRAEDLTERYAVLGAFQRAGVRFACVNSGATHDLNTTEGDLQVVIGSYFAAEWGRKHKKRIIEGKLTAIARGKKPAGPTPYGYRYDRETGVWSIDEAEASIVREIFDRTVAGETAQDVAKDLRARSVPRPHGGEWIRERVYNVLRQTAYRGEWTADKRRKLTIATPPIVDTESWFAARDRGSSLARRGRDRKKHAHLLEGIAVCAACGARVGIDSASFRGRTSSKPARYVCGHRRRPPLDGERCMTPYHDVVATDERVWSAITRFVLIPGRLERVARSAREEADQNGQAWREDARIAKATLARLKRTEAAILDRFRRELITEDVLDAELERHAAARMAAQRQLEAAERAGFASGRAASKATDIEATIATLRQLVVEATPAQRRELVVRLFKPGAVRLGIYEIQLDLEVSKSSRSLAGPVGKAGCSSHDETSIRFRLVA